MILILQSQKFQLPTKKVRYAMAASATTKKRGINLDELQQEVEKLLSLLRDRQPGLMCWNEFLHERIKNLHALTSQALGK